MDSSWARHLRNHYETAWGQKGRRLDWNEGPIQQASPGFFALAVPRSSTSLAIATVGMSSPDDAEPLELHMIMRLPSTPARESAVVELLVVTAHFHRTGQKLGHGHTVNLGRPWLPGSQCSFGLISLPYFDGPDLEWTEAPKVRCLWLVPITPAEREFKREHGLEALEERFDSAQVDLLDPKRVSIT